MEPKAKAIPEGCHSVNLYLTIKNASKAIEFYKQVFGAKEIGRISMPGGKIGHCELQLGDSRLMLADESPETGNSGPLTLGGSPVGIVLYVEKVDEVFKKSLDAGAKIDREMTVKDQFYGDRSGSITDPFGHKWTIANHFEDVSYPELQKRADKMMSEHHPQG
jgi:PhnB protein